MRTQNSKRARSAPERQNVNERWHSSMSANADIMIGIRDKFDTGPDFGECHRTYIEKVEWLICDEGYDLAFWLGAAQFRKDVGVE